MLRREQRVTTAEMVGVMIPILTQSITYTGMGIGPLPDTLTCQVTHEINGEYELHMTYPTTGENYGEILIDRLIWATPDHYTREQAFRIYRITRPLNNVVTIYARHVCYDASGIIVEPFTEGSLTAAINTLPTKCVPSCPFTITSARTVATQYKLEEPRPLWRVFGGEQGSMLDVYGGEWDFDNLDADLKSRIGADRGVEIRYGKNLTQLEQDVTVEATYAGVYPYWYDEESGTLVTLPEHYITITGATGDRVMLLDLSGDFDTQPTAAQLRTRANAYITANDVGNPKISWKINMAMLSQSPEFADMAIMDTIALGDTVHVFYEPMDLTATARAVKLVYNVLTERYDGITLGRVKQNLAKIIVADQNATNTKIEAAKSSLEKAIDQATDFITNGAGYMRFIYNSNNELQEIVSLENPDITHTPQNVWRWNNGGFGFSPYGYAGPYTTAIDQSGSITADFITAGTMSAARIRTGLLTDEANKFSLDLDSGVINMASANITGGTININTTSGTTDYITLNYNGTRNQMSPYGLRIWENNSEKSTSIERGRMGVSHYVAVGDVIQEKITSSLGDGTLQLGCASSGYNQAGYLSVYNDAQTRTIHLNGSSGTVSASNGTASASLNASGSVSLSNGTNTAGISSTLAYWYNGSSSKYTALMWPDSNGSGRLVFGDGTSTVWRTSLTNDGLTFRDAADNVTAKYPADGSYLKFVNTTAANYTLSGTGYASVAKPAELSGKKVISADIYSYVSANGAFAVTGYNSTPNSCYIVGTPGTTINSLIIQFWYIDI